MNLFEFTTESSAILAVFCVAAGVLYAVFFYFRESNFSKSQKLIFGTLRFLLISILSFLLLNPLFKTTQNYIEKPTLVLAVDNSESLLQNHSQEQLNGFLDSLKTTLSSNSLNVEIITPNASNKVDFSEKSTNLSALLKKVENSYEGRNLISTILISDGVHNQGVSPEYVNFSTPIYAIGLGDSTEKNDVFIAEAKANKTAFLGNKFPLEIQVGNLGFKGKNSKLIVKLDDKVLLTENIAFNSSKQLQKRLLLIDAVELGKHEISIEIQPISEEENKKNNLKKVFVEVLEGKTSILIYASAPHPDIKALKRALEKKQNFDIQIAYSGQTNDIKKEYDLVVYHKIPTLKQPELSSLAESNTLYIMDLETDLSVLSSKINTKIIKSSNQTDEVYGSFSTKNEVFQLTDEELKNITQFPPIRVPFLDFQLAKNSKTILYQRIGSLVSEKPLLFFEENEGRKIGVFTGNGFWKWRITEYAENDNPQSFDAVFQKSVQYLSQKLDKRQFRVTPISNEFTESQNIILETELFNDLIEPVYDKKVTLTINKGKKLSFVPSASNNKFNIGTLPEGVYKYSATTTFDNKTLTSNGSFFVKTQNLENQTSTADYDLLRSISNRTNGQFFTWSEKSKLIENIQNQNYKSKIIDSFEELEELSKNKWLLIVLLLLVTMEWALRKYNGFI